MRDGETRSLSASYVVLFGQCNYDIVTFTSKRHFGYTDSVCIIPKSGSSFSADAGADRESLPDRASIPYWVGQPPAYLPRGPVLGEVDARAAQVTNADDRQYILPQIEAIGVKSFTAS